MVTLDQLGHECIKHTPHASASAPHQHRSPYSEDHAPTEGVMGEVPKGDMERPARISTGDSRSRVSRHPVAVGGTTQGSPSTSVEPRQRARVSKGIAGDYFRAYRQPATHKPLVHGRERVGERHQTPGETGRHDRFIASTSTFSGHARRGLAGPSNWEALH